jgi:hypothetical protein
MLFHVVGAFGVHETLARLQSKYEYARHVREDRKTFENLQLQFRQVHDTGQWWQAICEAARQMDFAWVSLRMAHADGHVHEELWRAPNSQPDLSTIITIHIPIRTATPGLTVSLELAMARNGTFETTGRRTTLFARLLDENAARPLKFVS